MEEKDDHVHTRTPFPNNIFMLPQKACTCGAGPEGRNPEETEYKPKMTKKALKSLDLLEMSVSNVI